MYTQRFIAFIGLCTLSITFAYFALAQTSGSVKDVSFILTSKAVSAKKNDTVEVVLALTNPSKQNITSFETWITFDPSKVKGMGVDYGTNPDFDLNLIKSDPFFPSEKIAKVSRVATNPTAGKGDMILATLKFQVIADSIAADQLTFDFYKDSDGSLSKNSANVVVDDVVISVVDESKLKPLVIPLSQTGGGSSTTTNATINTNNTNGVNNSPNSLLLNVNTNTISGTLVQNINRNTTSAPVENILANTNSMATNTGNSFAELSTENLNTGSAVDHQPIYTAPSEQKGLVKTAPTGLLFSVKKKAVQVSWNVNPSSVYARIYYSKEKDTFLRYKDVKNSLGTYTFQNLQMNTTYYFVVSEVYPDGTEGDYSEEFEISTGTTTTVSADVKASGAKAFSISAEARASLAKVPRTTTSGPEQNIYLFAIMSMLIGLFYTFKHKFL